MTDRDPERDSLGLAWTSFGRRLAVAAGATTGLVSLAGHVPVWKASLRGALACLAVLAVVRVSETLRERLGSPPSEEEVTPEETRS